MGSLERNFIEAEVNQCREEGRDVGAIAERVKAAFEGQPDQAELEALYDELMQTPVRDDFPYHEPSELVEIRAARPEGPRRYATTLDLNTQYQKTYGGWLGRAAGCALGKPVEGWHRDRIDQYLESAQALPLDDYLPFVEKTIPEVFRSCTRGNIEFMDRDDDMDFPILGLLALEKRGREMTSRTVANTWLSYMPINMLYTAEQAAYRNFVMGIWPPASSAHRNPFREWIGAQIRADIFGYAMPGWPERAAELAYLDAVISHDKNGVYGEMFVAAMIAAAYVETDVDDIVRVGLSEIPAKSRLAEAITDTVQWCRQSNGDWQAVWQKINEHYGHYSGVHTINNAALVVLGLYMGASDFGTGIVVTVRGGWDTDCNGATVGSILGVRAGAKALPEKWVGVLNDRLISAVRLHTDNRISELAERTVAVAQTLAQEPKEMEKVPVPENIPQTWMLESDWGRQLLRFADGTVEFPDLDVEACNLQSASHVGAVLKFNYGIDKDGWTFEVDFEGKVVGDTLKGAFYPGDVLVTGKAVKD